jgi:hypothetical protein
VRPPPPLRRRRAIYSFSSPCPVQGYYEAGPNVAPPPVSDPMKYGPQHHQQPPPPPERTNKTDDEFCTGW